MAQQPRPSLADLSGGPTEDAIFVPNFDSKIFTDAFELWKPIIRDRQRHPQEDDEDSDTEELPDALNRSGMVAAGVKVPSRVRTRDPWGRDINVDDKPVVYHLPTRNKGPVDYIAKEPRFNWTLGVGGSSAAAQSIGYNIWGLAPSDLSHITGTLMDDVGLDPCRHTEAGMTNFAKVISVIAGDQPPLIDESPFMPKASGAEYDFSSIEMLLSNNDLNQVVPIRVVHSRIPSPVGIGKIPDGELTDDWSRTLHSIARQGTEVAASWWLAHLAYYFGPDDWYYPAIRTLINAGWVPPQVLLNRGQPLDYKFAPLQIEFNAEPGDKDERLANTFWTPKIQGVDGFPHYWWHPRESAAELDTRFQPVPVSRHPFDL